MRRAIAVGMDWYGWMCVCEWVTARQFPYAQEIVLQDTNEARVVGGRTRLRMAVGVGVEFVRKEKKG